jgi:hypothetical protein
VTEDELRAKATMPAHPVRDRLLALVRELGTVTSTEAARRLGLSSGLCSFHLRQLARYGFLEEAPARGRVRPWRLRRPATPAAPAAPQPTGPAGLDVLARELEDEGYRRWLAQRDSAPPEWRRDEAFSAVLYLTPDELGRLAGDIRTLLTRYAGREHRPASRPEGAAPVAALTRLFPLLPAEPDRD